MHSSGWTVALLASVIHEIAPLQRWAQLKLQGFLTRPDPGVGSPVCLLCDEGTVESAEHLLLSCPGAAKAVQVFEAGLLRAGLPAPRGAARVKLVLGEAPCEVSATAAVSLVDKLALLISGRVRQAAACKRLSESPERDASPVQPV